MKKIAIAVAVLMVLMMGSYTVYQAQAEKTEKGLIIRRVDLDNDGNIEKVVLENRKNGDTGDVYLTVDGIDYLIDKDFNDPDYKLYELHLDFVDIEDGKLMFVDLNQFVNGTGNNSYPGIYSFENEMISRVWELPNGGTPTLISKIIDDEVVFFDEKEDVVSSISLSSITEEQINVDSIDDIPEVIDDYFLSYPVSNVVVKEGKLNYLEVKRVVRSPVFYLYYSEKYQVSEKGIQLKSKHVEIVD